MPSFKSMILISLILGTLHTHAGLSCVAAVDNSKPKLRTSIDLKESLRDQSLQGVFNDHEIWTLAESYRNASYQETLKYIKLLEEAGEPTVRLFLNQYGFNTLPFDTSDQHIMLASMLYGQSHQNAKLIHRFVDLVKDPQHPKMQVLWSEMLNGFITARQAIQLKK